MGNCRWAPSLNLGARESHSIHKTGTIKTLTTEWTLETYIILLTNVTLINLIFFQVHIGEKKIKILPQNLKKNHLWPVSSLWNTAGKWGYADGKSISMREVGPPSLQKVYFQDPSSHTNSSWTQCIAIALNIFALKEAKIKKTHTCVFNKGMQNSHGKITDTEDKRVYDYKPRKAWVSTVTANQQIHTPRNTTQIVFITLI